MRNVDVMMMLLWCYRWYRVLKFMDGLSSGVSGVGEGGGGVSLWLYYEGIFGDVVRGFVVS